MKLKTKIAVLLAFSALTTGIAQDDQNKMAEKQGAGPYMSYVITQSGGDYTYAGINKDAWQIEVNPFKTDLKEIVIKRTINSRYFYPDNAAYAATFVDGWKETGKEMGNLVGVRFNESKRMVFTEEWVYLLENWKDKDNYTIVDCIKKGELTGFKLTKAAFGAKKEMEKANHKASLQKFLDDAFKKQAEVMATADGKDKEQMYRDDLAKAKKRYQFTVDSVNGKFWASEQGQRVKKDMAKPKVIVYNDTQTEFLFYHGQNVSVFLKPGKSYELTCKSGKLYEANRIPNNTTQLKSTWNYYLDLDGNNCGVTYNVSTLSLHK